MWATAVPRSSRPPIYASGAPESAAPDYRFRGTVSTTAANSWVGDESEA
jgi:hypothetical protein